MDMTKKDMIEMDMIEMDLTKKERQRISGRQRLIAQLSQNMNFVLDMNVGEFLTMHAECFVKKAMVQPLVEKVYKEAIALAGEDFELTTSITSLSGGQSRALMIADCAYISKAPIVLIDEIENLLLRKMLRNKKP